MEIPVVSSPVCAHPLLETCRRNWETMEGPVSSERTTTLVTVVVVIIIEYRYQRELLCSATGAGNSLTRCAGGVWWIGRLCSASAQIQ